jgi:DNA-binding MltR family transcriptional regulator
MARATLKSLGRKMPSRDEMHEALDHISREGAHTTVILGTALVEAALQMALRVRMYSGMSVADEASLFDGDGPLATFSAKIRMGFAFEVVNEEMRAELNRLRDIRNAFAHSKYFLKFETQEVSEACSTLSMPHVETGAPWSVEGDEVIWEPADPRDQFLVSIRLCWLFLYQAVHNPPRWTHS